MWLGGWPFQPSPTHTHHHCLKHLWSHIEARLGANWRLWGVKSVSRRSGHKHVDRREGDGRELGLQWLEHQLAHGRKPRRSFCLAI